MNERQTGERKRLYRSGRDRVFAGVCGGLGDYFDLDPVVVRLLFLVFAIVGGFAIPVYLILWLVTPQEAKETAEPSETIRENVREMADTARDVGRGVREALRGPGEGERRTPETPAAQPDEQRTEQS